MYSRSINGSFTATTSISWFSSALRMTIRPIRPKPLIPTLTFVDIRCGARLRMDQGAVNTPYCFEG
ncbi:hypothetical protein BD779DRAFT_1521696 [Infundibulicybe gibba]|nr:hypothetical protein BD779DRAFT_1521696 [Infundibulicybe gibba]